MTEIRDKVIEEVADRICNLMRDADDPLCSVCKFDTYCSRRIMHLIGEVLSIPEIAIVDRDAELPPNLWRHTYQEGQISMIKAGWIKENK